MFIIELLKMSPNHVMLISQGHLVEASRFQQISWTCYLALLSLPLRNSQEFKISMWSLKQYNQLKSDHFLEYRPLICLKLHTHTHWSFISLCLYLFLHNVEALLCLYLSFSEGWKLLGKFLLLQGGVLPVKKLCTSKIRPNSHWLK